MPTIQSELESKVLPQIVQQQSAGAPEAEQQPAAAPKPPRIPHFRELRYQKITDVHRVLDLDLPEKFKCQYGTLSIPEVLRKKDVHYIVNAQGQVLKAAWIHRSVGLFLNSIELLNQDLDAAYSQLSQSVSMIDDEVSSLVKHRVLNKRSGPGFMAFCQAHESVPRNCIMISAKTYSALCAHNRGWQNTRQVSCTRYPNLGPDTTLRLNLLVNDSRALDKRPSLAPTSLGARLPQLADLLREMEREEELVLNESGHMDAVYLHPEVLKNCLQGDGDGDLLFCKRTARGRPRFQNLNMEREAGELNPKHVEQLFRKGDRVSREDLVEYLPQYFDDTPIGKATYAVRWLHYLQALLEDSTHPMHSAWLKTGPEAIELIEFIMDMRKGESTTEEILNRLAYIDSIMAEISEAQESGDWFARTVTAGSVQCVDEFVDTFSTLQQYLDHITCQEQPEEEPA